MTAHTLKISDTNEFYIDDTKIHPFTKKEAEQFVSDHFHEKNLPEIVSFPNSSFYLIYITNNEYQYFDKNGAFFTFSKIHNN